MVYFIKKFKKTKSNPQENTGGTTSSNGIQHPVVNSFSSKTVLFLTLSIIVVAAILISLAFTQTLRNFLIQNRTTTVFSLIEQQEKRHLGDAPIFSVWDQLESKQKFKDFEDELLGSCHDIVAIELYTPEGVLAWSSIRKGDLGTDLEKDEIADIVTKGTMYGKPSASTMAELGIKELIEVYVPVHKHNSGEIVGIAEVYLNMSDILALTQYTIMILWTLIMVSVILIFLLLNFSFQYRDTQILARTKELEDLTKNLEKKVRERTKHIEDDKIRDEALLANLGEGVISTDNKGVITTMNHAAEKMLQWRADEVVGEEMGKVIPALNDNDEPIPPEKRTYLMTVTTGKPTTTESDIYFIKKKWRKSSGHHKREPRDH